MRRLIPERLPLFRLELFEEFELELLEPERLLPEPDDEPERLLPDPDDKPERLLPDPDDEPERLLLESDDEPERPGDGLIERPAPIEEPLEPRPLVDDDERPLSDDEPDRFVDGSDERPDPDLFLLLLAIVIKSKVV